jgi:hypothetical protein
VSSVPAAMLHVARIIIMSPMKAREQFGTQEWLRYAALLHRPVESSVSLSMRCNLSNSRDRRGQLKQLVRRMASTRKLNNVQRLKFYGSKE